MLTGIGHKRLKLAVGTFIYRLISRSILVKGQCAWHIGIVYCTAVVITAFTAWNECDEKEVQERVYKVYRLVYRSMNENEPSTVLSVLLDEGLADKNAIGLDSDFAVLSRTAMAFKQRHSSVTLRRFSYTIVA